MQTLTLNLSINSNLYVRDPQGTKLGKKIIGNSVLLIDELGIDQFTFRKLAYKIDSTEASIYRYFENKHQVFVYLLNWYWEWMGVRLDLNTLNVRNPVDKLLIAMRIITDVSNRNAEMAYINEEILYKIVLTEGAKGYHHKLVDQDNSEGFFLSYKKFSEKIASYISEIDGEYSYPRAIASMLIETANNSLYFAQHLPRLTDLDKNDGDLSLQTQKLLEHLIIKLLDLKIEPMK